MAYDEDTAIVLWPEYFDISRTRAEGRRLPTEFCVQSPKLDVIAKAAIMLNLEYRVLEDKCYPANRTARSGCVKVERGKIVKTQLLREVGKIMKSNN